MQVKQSLPEKGRMFCAFGMAVLGRTPAGQLGLALTCSVVASRGSSWEAYLSRNGRMWRVNTTLAPWDTRRAWSTVVENNCIGCEPLLKCYHTYLGRQWLALKDRGGQQPPGSC